MIYDRSAAIDKLIGFMDGTAMGISRPKFNLLQRVDYNGHKQKTYLKFQAVTSPEGMILNVSGPIEGRRNDQTLYLRSGLEGELPEISEKDGKRYCISVSYTHLTLPTILLV